MSVYLRLYINVVKDNIGVEEADLYSLYYSKLAKISEAAS